MKHPLTKESALEYIEKKRKLSWQSFDDYYKSTWILQTYLDRTDWRNSFCNCVAFQKNYKCIHVIGLAYRYKLIDIPQEAKNIQIGQKRRKGRPKKQKKALFYQNDIENEKQDAVQEFHEAQESQESQEMQEEQEEDLIDISFDFSHWNANEIDTIISTIADIIEPGCDNVELEPTSKTKQTVSKKRKLPSERTLRNRNK